MTADVPVVHEKHTLSEVRSAIERHADRFSTINYIYVLDDAKKLVGVMSLRDLFRNPPSAVAGEICKRSSLVSVKPNTDQEHAALLALRNNIKAVPVVGDDRAFLGELPNDAILSILYKEMHEDALRMAGIRHAGGINANVLQLSLFDSLKHRIPWLIIGLFGGIVSARIIGLFEATLQENLILAAFLPLIVYMSSAVGTQMQAYVVRDLAMDRKLPFGLYLGRNVMLVLAISALLAVLLGGITHVLHGNISLSRALALALFGATMSSVLTGLIIPYSFSRLRFDPADASGPVATIIQDMLSILIYFGIANALI